MHVSEWIRTNREHMRLTQDNLAELAKCSVSSIKAWESGKREPSAKSMVMLSGLFPMPESLQAKGASFAIQDGKLSVHRDVYKPVGYKMFEKEQEV